MTPENLMSVLMCIAAGSLIAWIGRTRFALAISYLLIGGIAAAIAILGREVGHLSNVGSHSEGWSDTLLSRAIGDAVDLRFLAERLRSVPDYERNDMLAVWIILGILVATLPFVVLSNALYVIVQAGRVGYDAEGMRADSRKDQTQTTESVSAELAASSKE